MGKGKTEFSQEEYDKIRNLITQLESADANKKKNIRSKIRNIGLYWSEVAGNIAYTVANFDNLIQKGILKITPDPTNNVEDNNLIETKILNEPLQEKRQNRVFISYKRKDKENVFPLKEKIENLLGEKCWIDLDGIESDAQFVSVIIKAIKECEIFLFMYSNQHNNIEDYTKDWTIRELQYAEQLDKKIVFINIDRSELGDWFSFMFGQKQQVDAQSEEAINRLINDLKSWLDVNPDLEGNKFEEIKPIEENTSNQSNDEDTALETKDEGKPQDSVPRSKAFKPKENEYDRAEFNCLNDIFPIPAYSYDYIVNGITIKKIISNSKKIGVVSFSECKRTKDGEVRGNLYFLPLNKNHEVLKEKNIEYAVAWNDVPFVRNVNIETGHELIKVLLNDLERVIEDKIGNKKTTTNKSSNPESNPDPEKIVEIKDVKFYIENSNKLGVEVPVYSTMTLHSITVTVDFGEIYFYQLVSLNKNKTKKFKFLLKDNQLPLTSGMVNDLNISIQVSEKKKIIAERKINLKLFYKKSIFTKNKLIIAK